MHSSLIVDSPSVIKQNGVQPSAKMDRSGNNNGNPHTK